MHFCISSIDRIEAFIAAEGLSPRSSWLIENLKADDWLSHHLRAVLALHMDQGGHRPMDIQWTSNGPTCRAGLGEGASPLHATVLANLRSDLSQRTVVHPWNHVALPAANHWRIAPLIGVSYWNAQMCSDVLRPLPCSVTLPGSRQDAMNANAMWLRLRQRQRKLPSMNVDECSGIVFQCGAHAIQL